ncbi:MAG: HDOD domain-containing protein [Planctomycetota bacterium]
MIDIPSLVTEAKSLEPLPQSSSRLAGLLAGDAWEINDICGVVRLDEALTGRLLGVANSARAGAREPIDTVDAAVLRLGSGTVLGIALAGSVRNDYQTALPAYGLDEGGLWRHSVAAALAVDKARRFCRRPVPTQAFATALLHDVGKLVLARHLTEDVVEALHAVQGASVIDAEVESTVLSMNHAELGGVVAQSWGLPTAIAEGIAYHEAPLTAPSDEGRVIATFVGLADAAAVVVGAPCGGPEPPTGFTAEIAGQLGISKSGFVELCSNVKKELEDVLAEYD